MAEVDDLQQVVADGAAWLAVRQMTFDFSLLAQLQQPIYVIRYEFLTLRANHVNHPIYDADLKGKPFIRAPPAAPHRSPWRAYFFISSWRKRTRAL